MTRTHSFPLGPPAKSTSPPSLMASPTRLLKRLVRQTCRHGWKWLVVCAALMLLSAALWLYALLAYWLAEDPRLVPETIQRARNVLLVTAHPDDETLFFSPTILHGHDNPDVTRALLVLSTGESLCDMVA